MNFPLFALFEPGNHLHKHFNGCGEALILLSGEITLEWYRRYAQQHGASVRFDDAEQLRLFITGLPYRFTHVTVDPCNGTFPSWSRHDFLILLAQ